MLPRSRSRAKRRMKKSSRGASIRVLSRTPPTLSDTRQVAARCPDPNAMPIELSTFQDMRSGPLPEMAFNEVALRDGLSQIRVVKFPAATPGLADPSALGEVLLDERSPVGFSVLLRSEDGLLIALSVHRGAGSLAVAGIDAPVVERLTAELVARLRDDERHADTVPITFWTGGAPTSPRRRIPAPSWNEVDGNYSAATQDALEPVMTARARGHGGLLLWHGEPGTGKSYALRALAREWLDWCDTHFITDPDAYLGGDTSYLLDGLMRSRGRDRRRWRLIVLEDAGELLAADARAV